MNNYEIQGFLGEGAYGIVLKAVSKKTKEIVAIKKFKDKDTENPVIKKVIIRELRALRGLKHPNIVTLREAFKQSERLFLVFEFCEQSLLDLQSKSAGNRLTIPVVHSVAKETLSALDHMHSSGMVHRDLKPENILVTADGVAKVCDFGFARLLKKEGEDLTDYVATRWYRSPELLLTPRYGFPADVWAMGCVLGEMLDGQPLFPGDNFLDQLGQIHAALGAFPESYREFCECHPDLVGIDFSNFFEDPPGFNPFFLRDRYLHYARDESIVDLIEQMLALDSEARISIKQALLHPFLATPKAPAFKSSHPLKKHTFNSKMLQENSYSNTTSSGLRGNQFSNNTKKLTLPKIKHLPLTLSNQANFLRSSLLISKLN